MMNTITAVLFDLDGTLLDTREFVFQAFEHALSARGFPVSPREELALLVGRPLPDTYKQLTKTVGEELLLLTEAHHEFQTKHYDLSAPFPGAEETLRALKEKGLKLGVVTNRYSRTAMPVLRDAGLLPLLASIVCFDQTEKAKPDPLHPLQALTALNELPQSAAMVGDSHFDIAAGRDAGMRTVFARYGFHHTLPKGLVPDATIDDIRDILTLIG